MLPCTSQPFAYLYSCSIRSSVLGSWFELSLVLLLYCFEQSYSYNYDLNMWHSGSILSCAFTFFSIFKVGGVYKCWETGKYHMATSKWLLVTPPFVDSMVTSMENVNKTIKYNHGHVIFFRTQKCAGNSSFSLAIKKACREPIYLFRW